MWNEWTISKYQVNGYKVKMNVWVGWRIRERKFGEAGEGDIQIRGSNN